MTFIENFKAEIIQRGWADVANDNIITLKNTDYHIYTQFFNLPFDMGFSAHEYKDILNNINSIKKENIYNKALNHISFKNEKRFADIYYFLIHTQTHAEHNRYEYILEPLGILDFSYDEKITIIKTHINLIKYLPEYHNLLNPDTDDSFMQLLHNIGVQDLIEDLWPKSLVHVPYTYKENNEHNEINEKNTINSNFSHVYHLYMPSAYLNTHLHCPGLPFYVKFFLKDVVSDTNNLHCIKYIQTIEHTQYQTDNVHCFSFYSDNALSHFQKLYLQQFWAEFLIEAAQYCTMELDAEQDLFMVHSKPEVLNKIALHINLKLGLKHNQELKPNTSKI